MEVLASCLQALIKADVLIQRTKLKHLRGPGELWCSAHSLAATTGHSSGFSRADRRLCLHLSWGLRDCARKGWGVATGEPTFIVNLEVKENQGLVFHRGVGEAVVQDSERAGALQLEVTGLAAVVGQFSGVLKHTRSQQVRGLWAPRGGSGHASRFPVNRRACWCVRERGAGCR